MKKLISAFAVSAMAVAVACPYFSASAETALHKGDTIEYTFTVGECPNIAGISVDSYFDPEYLTLSEEPQFLIGGQGLTNTNESGKIRWNTMITGGRAFSDEDILVETFTVNKSCDLDETGLSFECTEIFSHDLQMLSADLISARIDITETGTDEDDGTDTENTDVDVTDTDETKATDTDSETSTASTTSVKPINITSTDLTQSDEDIVPQNSNTASRRTTSSRTSVKPASASSTSSEKNTSSKNKSESSKTASSEKSETTTTPQTTSSAVSSKAESSKASSAAATTAASTTSPKTTTSGASPVSTAGRIAIALIAAVCAAAGAAVILAKKLKVSDR